MAPRDRVQPVGGAQQCGLARAGEAHENRDLAARHAQIRARHPDDDAVLLLNVGARSPAIESRQRLAQSLAPVAAIGSEQNVDVLEFHGRVEFHRRVHRESPRSLGRLMRSKTIASSTMVNPASKPIPTCTELSARTTGTPRPPAPTRAAITTMDRLSMMH